MGHIIIPKIDRFGEAAAESICTEPPDAWCQFHVREPGDYEPDEPQPHPSTCWFTILADGWAPFGPSGMYDGPPTELRAGEVEFTKVDGLGEDYCTWHYRGDPGGHDYRNVKGEDR
jgi:hypothetical protein